MKITFDALTNTQHTVIEKRWIQKSSTNRVYLYGVEPGWLVRATFTRSDKFKVANISGVYTTDPDENYCYVILVPVEATDVPGALSVSLVLHEPSGENYIQYATIVTTGYLFDNESVIVPPGLETAVQEALELAISNLTVNKIEVGAIEGADAESIDKDTPIYSKTKTDDILFEFRTDVEVALATKAKKPLNLSLGNEDFETLYVLKPDGAELQAKGGYKLQPSVYVKRNTDGRITSVAAIEDNQVVNKGQMEDEIEAAEGRVDAKLATKVDKAQLNYTNNPDTVVLRNASGRAKITAGQYADEIVNKGQMDGALAGKLAINKNWTRELAINMETYVISWKDENGTTHSKDLPIEMLPIDISYDSANKELVFELEDGSFVRVDVSDLVSDVVLKVNNLEPDEQGNITIGIDDIGGGEGNDDLRTELNNRYTKTDIETYLSNNYYDVDDVDNIIEQLKAIYGGDENYLGDLLDDDIVIEDYGLVLVQVQAEVGLDILTDSIYLKVNELENDDRFSVLGTNFAYVEATTKLAYIDNNHDTNAIKIDVIGIKLEKISAKKITYDNADSSLEAENFQDAIDEVVDRIIDLEDETARLSGIGETVIERDTFDNVVKITNDYGETIVERNIENEIIKIIEVIGTKTYETTFERDFFGDINKINKVEVI